MAIQTVKHGDHEHVVRSTKETVLGIVIDDSTSEKISEAFGWNEEVFQKFFKTYEAFINFQNAAEELEEDLPKSTKISNLTDFLKSSNFKRLGIKIETPNDYFMLGFLFSSHSIFELKKNMNQDGIGRKIIGGPINPAELIKLLKELIDK